MFLKIIHDIIYCVSVIIATGVIVIIPVTLWFGFDMKYRFKSKVMQMLAMVLFIISVAAVEAGCFYVVFSRYM